MEASLKDPRLEGLHIMDSCLQNINQLENGFVNLSQKGKSGVPGVENYHKHPGNKLEGLLAVCLWKKVGHGLWEKGQSRILVDPNTGR